MKKFMFAAVLLAASVSSANFCAKWQTKERYNKAINTLAGHRNEGVAQLCSHAGLLDVYVAPTHYIKNVGEDAIVVPLTRVELIYSEWICQYFVQDDNQTLYKSNCYSTF